MRHDVAGETYCNALCALCEQQRKLHRQCYRLLVSPIVRWRPFGGFGVEHHFLCKRSEAGFNVTRSCCTISCENIAPVSLSVNEQLLLSELDYRIANGGITMRVVFHGVAHNVGNLVIPTVIQFIH